MREIHRAIPTTTIAAHGRVAWDVRWGAIAMLATWMMTLFITRTEHRDTLAIHAKIDELLRAHGEARTELSLLDEEDIEEIEAHRVNVRKSPKE